MSITKTFNGRQYTEPDVAARILGGNSNVSAVLSFGNVTIIDTGSNAGFGGGAGINGQLKQGKDTIFTCSSATEAKSYLKGGLLWDLVDYLFSPSNNGGGINQLNLIKAATTEAATLSMTFDDGVLPIFARTEGLFGNGVLNANDITVKGYSSELVAGIIDPAKFRFAFYEGGFVGLDYESEPYNGILQADSSQTRLYSPEFTTILQAYNWMKIDPSFNTWFEVGTPTGVLGAFIAGDITANPLTVFAGGTETYGSDDLADVLSEIDDLDNTFFLADKYEADAGGTENNAILNHIINDADFIKYMIVGGATTLTNFDTQSIAVAQNYNTSRVVVVDSGCYQPRVLGAGQKMKPSIYSAALVLGRIAGLEPQTPATWKDVKMLSPVNKLNKTNRIKALGAGVLHFKKIPQIGWAINQAVNTLQLNNIQLINPDGQSFEISVERINAQLNRELVNGARVKFVGKNAATASPADIESFIKGLLGDKIAKPTQDNLILDFRNVKATIRSDSFYATYEVNPNTPVNNGFITGYAFELGING